jgi:hypothetical protein
VGWLSASALIELGKRRFNHWRLCLGPYDVWFMQESRPDQPLKLRIHQRTRGPVSVERVDVSVIYIETIVQFNAGPATGTISHATLMRDRELWSSMKTSAFENRFFPANSLLEILTEFSVPEAAELQRTRDREESKTSVGGNTEETRHVHWRVRIDTYRKDGRATTGYFGLPAMTDDRARSDTETDT